MTHILRVGAAVFSSNRPHRLDEAREQKSLHVSFVGACDVSVSIVSAWRVRALGSGIESGVVRKTKRVNRGTGMRVYGWCEGGRCSKLNLSARGMLMMLAIPNDIPSPGSKGWASIVTRMTPRKAGAGG
jgi:hypothetical protein